MDERREVRAWVGFEMMSCRAHDARTRGRNEREEGKMGVRHSVGEGKQQCPKGTNQMILFMVLKQLSWHLQ